MNRSAPSRRRAALVAFGGAAAVAAWPAARAQEAFFLHPVCGPLTLEQALRLDLLHLRTHRRQLAARKASASNPPA